MLKTTTVTKPFIVVWIPNTLMIDLESKNTFERKLKHGIFNNQEYQYKEFDTFEETDKFVNKLWEI